MTRLLPTKANLLAAKRRRTLAQSGALLLDKKQAILSQKRTAYLEKAHALQSQMGPLFSEAYAALERANIALGQCDQWAEAIEPDRGLTLRFYSVMGIELPSLGAKQKEPTLSYGFTGTDSTLDEALICFHRVKTHLRELAQAENTLYRLNQAIDKTGRRARALNRALIPELDRNIRLIEEILAQREQEAFLRQKRIKSE